MKVPYFEQRDFPKGINDEIDLAIKEVVQSGQFILSEKVDEFEGRFAEFSGASYCISVANGFDALRIAMFCLGLKSGDEVLINANTIPVTIQAIKSLGAIPVLVDFDESTGQISLNALEEALSSKTKLVLPVHLYFQSSDMISLVNFCKQYNLVLMEDFAHCHDSYFENQKLGTFGAMSATSFYPTKILGAFGDAGAILCNNFELYEKAKAIRNYGKDQNGNYGSFGLNSRMDELQAAVLLVKLHYFDQLRTERIRIFNRYYEALEPWMLRYTGQKTVAHIIALKVENSTRIRARLLEKGIQTAVHYHFDLNMGVWEDCRWASNELQDKTLRNSQNLVSLPIYLGMTVEEQDYVIRCVKNELA